MTKKDLCEYITKQLENEGYLNIQEYEDFMECDTYDEEVRSIREEVVNTLMRCLNGYKIIEGTIIDDF